MESAGQRSWTKEQVFEALRPMLIDALGIQAEEVRPEASLINDLGAESIDFLDLAFKVKQTFGVDLPIRAVQDGILSWSSLDEAKDFLEARYKVTLTPEEIQKFRSLGVPAVLEYLAQHHGAKVPEGEAVEMAGALTRKLIGKIEAGGMKVEIADPQVIANLMLESLTSQKIGETMWQLLTVQALADFVATRVATQPAASAGP